MEKSYEIGCDVALLREGKQGLGSDSRRGGLQLPEHQRKLRKRAHDMVWREPKRKLQETNDVRSSLEKLADQPQAAEQKAIQDDEMEILRSLHKKIDLLENNSERRTKELLASFRNQIEELPKKSTEKHMNSDEESVVRFKREPTTYYEEDPYGIYLERGSIRLGRRSLSFNSAEVACSTKIGQRAGSINLGDESSGIHTLSDSNNDDRGDAGAGGSMKVGPGAGAFNSGAHCGSINFVAGPVSIDVRKVHRFL